MKNFKSFISEGVTLKGKPTAGGKAKLDIRGDGLTKKHWILGEFKVDSTFVKKIPDNPEAITAILKKYDKKFKMPEYWHSPTVKIMVPVDKVDELIGQIKKVK